MGDHAKPGMNEFWLGSRKCARRRETRDHWKNAQRRETQKHFSDARPALAVTDLVTFKSGFLAKKFMKILLFKLNE